MSALSAVTRLKRRMIVGGGLAKVVELHLHVHRVHRVVVLEPYEPHQAFECLLPRDDVVSLVAATFDVKSLFGVVCREDPSPKAFVDSALRGDVEELHDQAESVLALEFAALEFRLPPV